MGYEIDRARYALGEMLRLVEDGILVRSTKDDRDFMTFMQQSARLTRILREAQDVLAVKQ